MPVEHTKHIKAKSGRYGTVTVQVYSGSGLLLKQISQPMDSFVANWWRVFRGHLVMESTSKQNLKRISDGTGASQNVFDPYQFHGEADQGFLGVLVGSGNAPVGIDDWDLDQRIEHGTDPGQLEFNASQQGSDVLNADRECSVQRTMLNNSGGEVTVREVGMSLATNDFSNIDSTFLAVRDVLEEDAVIPDDGAITVSYTVRMREGVQMGLWPLFIACSSANISITRTDGTDRNIGSFTTAAGQEGIDGVNRRIRLGRGETPAEWDDYVEDDLITNGTGDGELEDGDFDVSSWEVDEENDEMVFTIEQLYTNQGDEDVTIREMSIRGRWATSLSASHLALVTRVVLPSEVLFTPGRSDFFRFTIRYSL